MFDEKTARLWMAMDIGPLWIGRDEDDPLSPAAIMREPVRAAVGVAQKEAPSVRPESAAVASHESPRQDTLASRQTVPSQRPLASAARVDAKVDTRLDSPGTSRANDRVLAPIVRAKDVPGSVGQRPVSEADIQVADWATLQGYVAKCQACQSISAARLSTVFGVAEPTARMVIIGEAPGKDEDLQGLPFVGKSGELLENILHALGLARGKDVAIINVLKCRPPNNRDPHPDEMAVCRAYLDRQLQLLDPKVVVLAGRIAAHALLGSTDSMSHLRGASHTIEVNGKRVPAIVTYHPSYLLRSPSDKMNAWRDFMTAKHTLLNL